mgnify:FL=1
MTGVLKWMIPEWRIPFQWTIYLRKLMSGKSKHIFFLLAHLFINTNYNNDYKIFCLHTRKQSTLILRKNILDENIFYNIYFFCDVKFYST